MRKMNDVYSFFPTVQFSLNFTTPSTLTFYSTSYYNGPPYYFEEPVWLQVLLAILFATITVLGVGGNAIVIYIVLWNRRMRTPTNYFIVNLALSDILAALMCINFTYYSTMYMSWPFGRIMCKLVQFMQNASISVSIFTLVAISLDRYFVILYPLRPKLGKKKASLIICLIWVCSCAFALPVAIFTDLVDLDDETSKVCSEKHRPSWSGKIYSSCAICVQYVLPLIILGVTYGRIGYVVWSRKTPGEREEKRDRILTESKLKLVKMFATIVLLFAICYLPMYVFFLVQDHNELIINFEYIKLIYLGAFFVGMSNCVYNPMIYCYMNSKFRNGFKSVLPCLRYLPCIDNKPADQWHGYARSTLRTYVNAAPAASPIKVVLKQNGEGDVTTELCHPPNWNNYHSINGNRTARL